MTGSIERVGVLGCGLMGAGIGEVCARAGVDVVVVEVGDAALARGRNRILRSLNRAVETGKLEASSHQAAVARLAFSTDLDAFADRQLVVEAVPEVMDLKLDAFRTIDRIVKDDNAILASNTSSIPVVRLAAVTNRPEQVLGLHFFNPVPVLRLVEVVSSLLTSPAVRVRAEEFATHALGKQVIRSQDRAGFVVTRCSCPTCSQPSGCSSPASPQPRTSTRGWWRVAPIPWVPFG